MVNVTFYYLDHLKTNFFNLAQDLYLEVLIAMNWTLWQRLLLVVNCALIFFSTMFYHIQKCIHQLMRYLRYQPGKALLKGINWTYYGLVILYQQDAYKVILRAIQYQLLFYMTMACLDWMWMMGFQAVKRGLQFLKQEKLQIMDSRSARVHSQVYISVFHANEVLLNKYFSRPSPSTFQKIFSSFSFLTMCTNIKKGMRYFCFGTSSGQNTGIQSKNKEESGLTLSRENIIYQFKSTLVTFFLFYVYSTFPFVRVIK